MLFIVYNVNKNLDEYYNNLTESLISLFLNNNINN